MKLCPPASSSDVEVARAIAQRLSRSPGPDAVADEPGYLSFAKPGHTPPPVPPERDGWAQPSAPDAGLPDAEEGLPEVEVDVPGAETPQIPSEPEPFAESEPAPTDEASPFEPEPFARPEPAPTDEASPFEPEPFAEPEPAPTDEVSPFEREPFARPEPAPTDEASPFEPEPSADPLADLAAALPGLPADDPLAGLTAPAAPEAVPDEFDPLAALAESPEVLPSWSEILETCQRLAEARGAMLVGPDGMVVEFQGEWPQAGAQAVADKLGPIVAKKHQASPGAAVSLRLGPSILTAWKVQVGGAEPTVAFVADRAVAPVVRPEIEEQLRRGELD